MKPFIFSCVVLLLLVVSCDKYNSTIEGNVFYSKEGTIFPATNAIVFKQRIINNDTTTYTATTCDSNGYYFFNQTTKGEWILKCKLNADSLIYEGITSPFNTDGENKITLPDLYLELLTENN